MEAWKSEMLEGGLHALAGGTGTTIVMLSGWPQTAEAYSEVFPLLAPHYEALCIDPPGLGDSAPAPGGYDTGAISLTLEEALQTRVKEPFHLVGHDAGAWIAYAWAAQFPQRVRSLTLLDSALPGLAAPQNFPLPYEMNVKLWQFAFNTLPELPELLTAGRERELFDWMIQHKAVHPERISSTRRQRYVEAYAQPGGMSRGFAYYRDTPLSAAQNAEFARRKLPMPLLALGASGGMGSAMKAMAEPLAARVEGGVIEDCGHYMLEEQPQAVAQQLLGFLRRVEQSRF